MSPAPEEKSPAGTVVSSFPSIPPDRDLYTIPLRSSWFSWEDIHDTERAALPEFFDASSAARSPKIYKEYRDFIICKYREDPTRRLTFTEIRKSLVGDVRTLRKVFSFLDASGLINFSVAEDAPGGKGREESSRTEGEEFPAFLVEEGPPNGVKVAPFPNSTKSLLPPSRLPSKTGARKVGGSGFRMPPLTSYSDVFGGSTGGTKVVCAYCGEQCSSGHYESKEGAFSMCMKCFKNENDGVKTEDDFTLMDSLNGSSNLESHEWTDSETLHLLEAIIAKKNDWALISDQARRSKSDCITRLIQLPFGEHISGSIGKCNGRISNNHKTIESAEYSLNKLDSAAVKLDHEDLHNSEHQEQIENDRPEPPLKRRCFTSCLEISDSMLHQVALISKVAGPNVEASAADAAVTALCRENPFARNVFNNGDYNASNDLKSFIKNAMLESDQYDSNDTITGELSKGADMPKLALEKNFLQLIFKLRAAFATAFGSAAAHAKMLADQEDQEIELLMATIIKNQVKKLQHKLQHLDELETIMEKEYDNVQRVKESVLGEWVNILQAASHAGFSYKWREQGYLKPPT